MKGYGIFVGVDETKHTPGLRFQEAGRDVQAMYKLVNGDSAFHIDPSKHLLLGKNATWSKTKNLLRHFSEKSKNESIFLVAYFTGHGFDKENPYSEEHGARAQFLSFYDYIVIENEIREELASFSKGSIIVIVLDACYSGGVPSGSRSKRNNRGIKRLSDLDFNRLPESHKQKCELQMKQYGKTVEQQFEANICYFAACEDDQTALRADGEFGLSRFTQYLTLVWNTKVYNGNYITFNQILKNGLHKNHSPKIAFSKKETPVFFQRTVPFRFNMQAMESSVNNYMGWSIGTDEVEGQEIKLVITPPISRYVCELITSTALNNISPTRVKNYIKQLNESPQYVTIVEVKIYHKKDTTFCTKGSRIRSVNPKSCRNGMIVILDSDNDLVLGHEYTEGEIKLITKNKNYVEYRNK